MNENENENKGLILKVFKINYEFIISNYLSPNLWEKKWVLFEYKNFSFNLSLYSIDTKQKAVNFEIAMVDSTMSDCYTKDTIKYVLSINNLNILKKQIETTCFQLIKRREEYYHIMKSLEYLSLVVLRDSELEKLTVLAENFLDSEKVQNSEIRNAYIDYYVDNKCQTYSLIRKYVFNNQYKFLTDLYLVFAESVGNENRYNEIVKYSGCTDDQLKKLQEEIDEFKEYIETEEYSEEMQDALESI